MTAFINHFSFEFRAGVRNRTLLLLNYLFPLGFYLMAGALLVSLNPNIRQSLIPAMIIFTIMATTLLSIPDQIVTAREAGIYRSYRIHGVPGSSILTIPALATVLHALVVSIIIVITAPVLFQAPLPSHPLSLVLTFILTAMACGGLSLLIGVIAPNTSATVLLSQAVFLPSMMIGGLMFPAEMLPDALGKLALLLPTNHAMNIVNGWQPNGVVTLNPYLSVVILFVAGVIAFGLAVYVFVWDSHNRPKGRHPVLALLALLPYVMGVLASVV